MKNTTVALVAVVAVTAILLASMLTGDALAKKCRSKGGEVHQVLAQACINQNAPYQNVNSQNAGSDIASNTFGIQ